MQTFLPYSDFHRSAKVLDRQRLGKQRVEVLQIYKALSSGGGWSNHPATLMWKGYDYALLEYGLVICQEWRRRGYNDSLLPRFERELESLYPTGYPEWLGIELLHDSHKAHLYHKDPAYYLMFASYSTRILLWPKTIMTTSGMEVKCLVPSDPLRMDLNPPSVTQRSPDPTLH